MNLLDARMLFLDLQTTGSSVATGNILELAWCIGAARDAAPEVGCTYLLKQPDGNSIPRRIKALTGITEEDLQTAIEPRAACTELLNALSMADYRSHAVIHFAQFERPFLLDLLSQLDATAQIICTHQIAARLYPNLPSRGIRGLSGYFGLPLGELKRASCHVNATFDIWRNICKELKMRGIHSLCELEEWLAMCPVGKRTKFEYPMDRNKRLSLPEQPGVYRMLAKNGAVLYVGKATSLRDRVNSYFRGQRNRDSRKLEMLTQAWDLKVTPCQTVLEACLLEVDEIKRNSPPYNIALKTSVHPLAFYSRDFATHCDLQTTEHPVGPFRSAFVLQPVLLLALSINAAEFDPRIFFEQREPELLAAGFDCFLKRHQLQRQDISSVRALIAIGMQFYRAWRRMCEQSTVDAIVSELADDEEILSGSEDELSPDELSPDELSPDEIADRYERMLIQAAGALLLARRLSKLVNSSIEFQENGLQRKAEVQNGEISFFEVEDNSLVKTDDNNYVIFGRCSKADYPWSNLNNDTFDRMRVLHTELRRLAAQGKHLRIRTKTETPLRHSRKDVSAFS